MASVHRRQRPVHVAVVGAGLAGLTAARSLERAGARVTVIEARPRVGGRVHTLRGVFAGGQHAELGADLIEEEQEAVLALAGELGLTPVRILRRGFGFHGGPRGRTRSAGDAAGTFEAAASHLAVEIAAYKAAGGRWESGVARALARESVAAWLNRIGADARLRAGIRGLRGFFLADPEDLSLLVLVDQFAQGGTPGESRMYRLAEGNDSLPAALARGLHGTVLLESPVAGITHGPAGVSVAIGRRRERLAADYAVVTLPASTLRRVTFTPGLPADQALAIRRLRYGPATRVLLQFERRFWTRLGRPSAFGSDRPFGAVWDGNEQQARAPGILSFLAGGRAARELSAMVDGADARPLVRRLRWLGPPAPLMAAIAYSWDRDPWSRGGYAVFDHRFDPALRPCLARPTARLVFAGEHTSVEWQGFMNGAVESGRRAALEVAAMAGLPTEAIAPPA